MKHDGSGAFAEIPALARAVCLAPVGILNVVGVGWIGAEGIDPEDLGRILALVQKVDGFFETAWGQNCCAGFALRKSLGALCVLDDRARPPLTHEQRALLEAIGTQVVERYHLQRALAKLRPLSHLSRGIAHDMNNALQTIVGALNTIDKLIETNSLERTPRFLAAALRSAHRAGELTRNLQRLARSESGGSRAVELNALIDSLKDLFRRICGEHIDLDIRLSDTASRLNCDPSELEESLLILVIDAAEQIGGTGTILISSRQEGPFVHVCVQGRCLCLPAHPGG